MTIDARETASSDATPDMFAHTPNESYVGYQAVATPGELHGFWFVNISVLICYLV
jgi:gamma-glutamyltranspeptidase